jgi:hypothetical protein
MILGIKQCNTSVYLDRSDMHQSTLWMSAITASFFFLKAMQNVNSSMQQTIVALTLEMPTALFTYSGICMLCSLSSIYKQYPLHYFI